MGGYEGTQGMSAESLPLARPKAAILINKVPVDPSALFWGRNAGPRGSVKWATDLDPRPTGALRSRMARTKFRPRGCREASALSSRSAGCRRRGPHPALRLEAHRGGLRPVGAPAVTTSPLS